MSARRILVFYLGFLVLCWLGMKVGWLIPDGIGYCSYNASLYLDGDLNFWNQYASTGVINRDSIHGSALTANGYVFTFWAIGAPMLWMPFWLLGHAMTAVSHLFGQTWTPNGFTIYYNLAVRFATAVLGLCALLMNFFWARAYTGARAALLGILAVAIGTPYFWYWFHIADQSHVPAAFAISLFLIVWEAYRRGTRDRVSGFLMGILGGLVAIIKPNHLLIFLFPLSYWISRLKSGEKIIVLKELCWVAGGAILAVSLQVWIWQIIFGNPLGPILEKGVKHYYKFFAGRYWLPDVLFSSYHGLFFFAPVLVLSFWGLFRLIRKDPVVAIPSLLILILQILFMASERYFWEGAAFGLRRVVDWTPLFALGIVYCLRDLNRAAVAFACVAAVWTILLTFTYMHRPIGILNDYQPPSVILSWIAQSLSDLPDALKLLFSPPAPFSVLILAAVVLGPVGYLLVLGSIRITARCLNSSPSNSSVPRSLEILTGILLVSFVVTYVLVGRASLRGEASKNKYPREFQWLAAHQDAIVAAEEVSFLLNEARYLALSRDWVAARPSFVEALRISPNQSETKSLIAAFARQHITSDEAQRYIDSIANEARR